MRFQKDITDQFHEIVVLIVGEEILRLNDHQSGDEGKEGHFCVFMQQLFQNLEKLEEHLNLHYHNHVQHQCYALKILTESEPEVSS
jgi:hypothetical protein